MVSKSFPRPPGGQDNPDPTDSLDSAVRHFQAVSGPPAPRVTSRFDPPFGSTFDTSAISRGKDASLAALGQASSGVQGPIHPSGAFHGMAGRSPSMRRLFAQMQLTAPHLRLATIEGETGTGKTLAARTLHGLGRAAAGPFVASLASVFLAEEHGALALPWAPELIARSAGGMLFLDRVDELGPAQQSQLFQFLLWFDDHQEGPSAPHQVIVSSTVSLRRMAAADAVRSDLCSRLTAIRFAVPPLRERREDIPVLALFFAQRFAHVFHKQVRGFDPETLGPLLRYSWPGNVRELESVVTSAALQTGSQWIRAIDLPVLTAAASPDSRVTENDFNLDRVIARHIERTLERTRGNKLRAASLLGISRSTLYRILASN